MKTRSKDHIKVVAAILVNSDKRFMMAKKKMGTANAGLWEFPGGKVEEGESELTALHRELIEEMGIETDISLMFPFLDYTFLEKERSIHFYFFLVPLPMEQELKLTDHDEIIWTDSYNTNAYEIAPGDVEAINELKRDSEWFQRLSFPD